MDVVFHLDALVGILRQFVQGGHRTRSILHRGAVVLPPGEVANGHERSLASERGDQREQRLFTLRPDDEVDDAGREHGVGMLRRKVAAPDDLQFWPRSANRLAHWHGLNKLRAWHDGDSQQVRLRAVRGRKSVEPALKSTYGVIVYQEQVMQISKELSGFTGGQADTLRKAIGKKNPEVMKKMKSEFIEGAVTISDAPRALMEKFWKQLEDFAAYCFNKSHAACYALIAYQTAYLKAHYPAAFMAALMTSDYDNIDRLAIEISECKHMGLDVLPPDINQSFVEFAVVPGNDPATGQIRFGMAAIKNVGTGAVEEILRARTAKEAFATLEDFLGAVNVRVANRKALESLVKAGAFDRFYNRETLLKNMDLLLAYANRVQKQQAEGQTDLFGELVGQVSVAPKLQLEMVPDPAHLKERLLWERELLGIYLSQHPLESYEVFLADHAEPVKAVVPELDGKTLTIGGLISEIREITTKNGQKMAFVKIVDLTDETELLLFPNSYQQTAYLWEKDKVVLVKGKVSSRGKDGSALGEAKLMVNEAREITAEEASAYQSGPRKKKPSPRTSKAAPAAKTASVIADPRLYIRLHNAEDQQKLMSLKDVLDRYQGETEVVLVMGAEAQKQVIKLPMRASQSADLLNGLHEIVGADNVKLH